MSNAPTAERGQHGGLLPPQIDPAQFQPFWRACDRLEKLAAAGLITPRELRAALDFRRVHELAHRGPGGLKAQDWIMVRGGKHCGKPAPTMTERQAAALTRLRHIAQSLESLYPLVEMLVVEELCWREIGRRLRVHHHTAKTWTLAAIAALAAL